ncbi:serine hydrolase [Vreelandella populi]|uniref:serine hydrolase n=2 Tax=Halomonadaceae TaxID=28256 RepID=UPI00200FCC36
MIVFMMLLVVGIAAQAQANPRYAAIVLDAGTGEVLHSANADETRYPASLTKMMTLYLVFEAIEQGRLRLDQELPVSAYAASMQPSKLGVRAGERIAVRDAIPALIIRSANDVSVVIAEALGGTESQFAELMTAKARSMGMQKTFFRNANGLPDPLQTSTARDLATLSMQLMNDYPQYYHYFANSNFTWRGQTINGHNRLLRNYPGADGLKTGFIRASGFNVATSAVRDGRRVVAVVMGGFTAQSRDDHMMTLLDRGFMRASLQDQNDWVAQTNVSQQLDELVASLDEAEAQPEPALAETNVQTLPGAEPINLHLALDATPRASAPSVVSTPSTQSPNTPYNSPDDPILALLSHSTLEGGDWAVQIGAFQDADQARVLADRAMNYLHQDQAPARVAVTEVGSSSGNKMFRARLVDLEENQARNACNRLQQQGMDCLVVR